MRILILCSLLIICQANIPAPNHMQPIFNHKIKEQLDDQHKDVFIATTTPPPGDCVVSDECYNSPEPLGCFPQGPTTPFCKDYYAPMSPTEMNSSFHLFTPQQQNTAQIIDYFNLNSTILAVTNIDWSLPLTVIVHGWELPGNWQVNAKDALYANGYNMNVLLVYWIGGSKTFYPQGAANTRVIGAMMGLVVSRIDTLKSEFDMQKTTVAGHSLGGHISAFCANWVQQNHGVLMPFIDALDPAGPWFEGYPPVTRLDPTDAQFVQAMHCNGEPLAHIPPGYGSHEAMGHVDIFMNDGQEQPHCTEIDDAAACSHNLCPVLWYKSFYVKNNPQCQQWNLFPGDWHKPDDWNTGGYFDTTNACHQFGIDYRTQGNCNGSYYYGTTDGKAAALVDYYGSQYLFAYQFATSGFFDPTGRVDVRFHYGSQEDVNATESERVTTVDNLEGPVSRVYITPCTTISTQNGPPTQVGLTYRPNNGTASVTLNSLVITKVDGTSWNINTAKSLYANEEMVLILN